MVNTPDWYVPVVSSTLGLVLFSMLIGFVLAARIRRKRSSYSDYHGRTVNQDWSTDWGWVGYPVLIQGTHRTGIVIADSLTRYVLVRYDKSEKEDWLQRGDLVINEARLAAK